MSYLKSPMNYVGGKKKLLNQILKIFPTKINTFVDLFCGGCTVDININANKIIFNDIQPQLINLFKVFKDCDPPYLITTATYNQFWKEKEEIELQKILIQLNNKGIKFALSNVLKYCGLKNNLLIDFIDKNKFKIFYLNMDYKNSSYNKKDKNSKSEEVLITNF